MSLVIHYENGKLLSARQEYVRTTPSPAYKAKDEKTFVMGQVFDASFEDIAQSNWKEDPKVLNSFEGAISAAYADDDGCVFASDINGIEIWYTYHKGNRFILSDDFWDIVKIVQPSYEDIDPEQARLSLVALSVTGETLIRNLRLVPPFCMGKYDPSANQLSVSRYMDFKYTGEISDVEVAAERMDQILDQSMQKIKSICGDVVYGIGVSGGLDSRVIPHYALKNGMKLEGFNICVPRPHKLFLARSCKKAQEVAQAFGIPYRNTKWDPATVEEKVKTKVRKYPLGIGRNSFKYEPDMPEFDTLLTGASGLIVGSMLPVQINAFSREELIAEMQSFFNKEENYRTFIARAARGLNYLLGTKFSGHSESAIKNLVSAADIQKTRDGIVTLVDNGIRAGQTNLEIYEDFFFNVMGFRNYYGAYESIFGTKRSFSIYIPFLLKETLKWSPELLFNRKVLNELIVKKIPEVKNVQAELYEPAPGQKLSRWNKIANMVDFVVRGNGAAVDDYWMKKASVKKKLAARLNNGCQWFAQIFNTDAKVLCSLVIGSGESELMIDAWELKTLIDCLETKEYLHF